MQMNKYCQSRFATIRRKCSVADIGGVKVGGDYPIAVQSMTNTKTQDVEASVKQCIALAEAGCQIIRLTAQNLEAAKALGNISKKFRAAGFSNPLVADIHFLPQTAMEAAEHVEKIRINPGNFTDKKIPRERRASLPVFDDGTGIAWIPGLPPAERFRIRAAGTKALRLTYRRKALPL